ncbi:MAG: ferrous iron transport protein A [Verrucomicrobia bacterium]|nr:ferrous iron transport protein A [Verrucomicrobiota bacterium]
MNEHHASTGCPVSCPKPDVCPLNRLREGACGRVKQLSASPELNTRLRELGFLEDQHVKLLGRPSNIICQVCNARIALSEELAKAIWVEPLEPPVPHPTL